MKKEAVVKTSLFLSVMILALSCGKKDSGDTKGEVLPDASVSAGELIAVVSAKEGQEASARIMASGSTRWEAARVGQKLSTGDSLSVSEHANAMVHMQSGEEIALNTDTTIKLASRTTIELDKGEIWVNTSMSDGKEKLSFKTREGHVTIEGTIADVRFRDNVLRVSVVSGKATIVGERGEIEINGGEEAVLEKGQEFELAPVRDPGMLAAWTEAIRREITRTLSKEGEEQVELPRGLGTLSARVPGGKKDLPFNILKQEVTVKIRDQIALTRVEQVFENPTKSTVEGTYKFPIPHGARMNRFDMEIKGKMMQGEIVEREKGRAIMAKVIRQFVDMMRDPALVEWESGSTFKTRIFPITPKQKKRIVLSYVQTLDGEGGKYRYVLPVATPGATAPVIPEMTIQAEVAGTSGSPVVNTPLYPSAVKAEGGKVEISFSAKEFSPVVDFVIDVENEKKAEADLVTFGKQQEEEDKKAAKIDDEAKTLADKIKEAMAAEGRQDYFLLSLRPEFEALAGKPQDLQHWIVLVDTSQSRTLLDAQMQKNLLGAFMGNLSREDRIKVIAFDAAARVMNTEWEVPSRHFAEEAAAFIDAMPPAGATNIESALLEAAANLEGVRGARILLVGDGAATLGENRPDELAGWAKELFTESHATVSTLGIGSSIDNLLLEELATRTGGKFYYISSGEDFVTAAVKVIASLRTPLLRDVDISFEGIEVDDVYPDKIANLSSGQEIVVTGRYRGTGKLDVKLAGRVGDREVEKSYSFNVGEGKRANSFVPILWASRKIDELTIQGDEKEKEIVTLSKRFSLPSRYTSFIVLENDAMYKEFKVQQDKDRIEWEGEGDIEYEETLGQEEMEGDSLDMLSDAPGADEEAEYSAGASSIATKGIGSGGLKAGGATSAPAPAMAKSASAADSAAQYKKDAAPKSEEKERSLKGPPAKKAKASMELYADDLDGGMGGYYHYPSPKPQTTAVIKEMPVQVGGQKRAETIAALRDAVEKEPLVRTHRMKLISYLETVGKTADAFEAAKEWYAMDSGNAKAMTTLGDLMRLKGDLVGAMRFYSGVLDVSPEKTDLMENMAEYFEGRKLWDQAYPFRVSCSLTKPKDDKAAALRALAAARVGRWDDAVRAARDLFTESADGKLKLKKGVKLPADLREALLKVAETEKSPLLFELDEVSAGSSKMVVELTWDKPVDLDLWVLTGKGEFLGGGGDRGSLLVGETGGEGEVFLMKKPKKGRYTIQVACAEAGGCGNLTATVSIKAYNKSKTVKFVMDDSWGGDVASVRVKTEYAYLYK
jgi:Mg-chelatase subunit ChlD